MEVYQVPVQIAARAGSCPAGRAGSAVTQRKKIRWGTGRKMLIAISLDTAAFWDKSNWWTWRRMPGREWKSDMTPEKGSWGSLQQAFFIFFLIPMLYQLMPNVAKKFPLVSFFLFFLFFFEQTWISHALVEDAGGLAFTCCSLTYRSF